MAPILVRHSQAEIFMLIFPYQISHLTLHDIRTVETISEISLVYFRFRYKW